MTQATSGRLSVVIMVVMSAAALATSWSGYQASVWNGMESSHDHRAAALRESASRAGTRAGQHRIVDVQLFTSWLAAYAARDEPLASFYVQRFRPEFSPAFRTWVASRPLQSRTAAPSPFALREYRVAEEDDADRLARAADVESASSRRASGASAGYVFNAVLFATVVVFGSTAERVSRMPVRVVLLSVSLALGAAGVYRLLTLPVGWAS